MDDPRPLKICHVVLSLRPGGLENGVVNVINGLDRSRFRSSVCCLQEKGEFVARIRDPDVEVTAMGLQPGNDLRLPLRLAALFRRQRTDIVHTRNAESFFYGVLGARLAGVPRVVHSEHGRTFPEKRLRALAQRWLLRFVDYSFAVSARLKEDLQNEIGVGREQFHVLYNGVDLQKFPLAARRPERGEILIGSVGRLVKVKNYGLLLRAFARLPAQARCRLILIGDGPERAGLQAQAAQLAVQDRVQFAGHRDDVPRLLQDLDVFVLPSISEGMSNTMLEAMACGATVVASDVGGNRELVEHGASGLLFASDDLDGLTRALARVVTDEAFRAQLAAAAACRVRAEFSIQAMIGRYEDMYRAVARGSAP